MIPIRHRPHGWRHLAILAGLLLSLSAGVNAGGHYTLKFATLAPAGSTWMNLLQSWGDTVKERSEGRLIFKFYPGGVQGDEPDVLKKMRFGQLHGGAFTGYGIGRMYSPARVLELPFLFRDVGEIDFVRDTLTDEFRDGFRAKGFELLGWMEVGFVHIFSTRPVHSMDDMRSLRVWLWQGDPMGKAFFSASGISPVPLSIIDVYTSLSTGLVDVVYAPPLGAIALQWFTRTPYVSTQPITNGMGALVVSRRFFDRLPPDLQALLRDTGRETGAALIRATRADNKTSLDELRKRGLHFLEPGAGFGTAELQAIRDRAAEELMRSDYLPRRLVERTRQLLGQYRARADTGTDTATHTAGGTRPGPAESISAAP